MKAVCVFEKNNQYNKLGIEGEILFVQDKPNDDTKITISLCGFKPHSTHAIHIHEKSDFSNGCMSTGPHYNPYHKHHGNVFIHRKNRHVGDLINNITSDGDGVVFIMFQDDLVSLFPPFSVVDRAIVIHDGVDDLGLGANEESLKTGNAGGRAACAKIQRI